MSSFIRHSRNGKTLGTKHTGGGQRLGVADYEGQREEILGDRTVLLLWFGMQLYKFVRTQRTVHDKGELWALVAGGAEEHSAQALSPLVVAVSPAGCG